MNYTMRAYNSGMESCVIALGSTTDFGAFVKAKKLGRDFGQDVYIALFKEIENRCYRTRFGLNEKFKNLNWERIR